MEKLGAEIAHEAVGVGLPQMVVIRADVLTQIHGGNARTAGGGLKFRVRGGGKELRFIAPQKGRTRMATHISAFAGALPDIFEQGLRQLTKLGEFLDRQINYQNCALMGQLRHDRGSCAKEVVQNTTQENIHHAGEACDNDATSARRHAGKFPRPIFSGMFEVMRLPSRPCLGFTFPDALPAKRSLPPDIRLKFLRGLGGADQQIVDFLEHQPAPCDCNQFNAIAQQLFGCPFPEILITAALPPLAFGHLHHGRKQPDQIFRVAGTGTGTGEFVVQKVETVRLVGTKDDQGI